MSAAPPPAARPRTEQLRDFVAGARWFGGKGRPFEVTDVRRLWLAQEVADRPQARVAVELLTLRYADGGSDLYQLPLTYSPATGTATGTAPDSADAARVGTWDDEDLGPVVAHDALQDPASAALWLDAFIAGEAAVASPELTFHQVPAAGLASARSGGGDWTAKLLRGEQSNTSVVFGDQAMLKVFRRLAPGQNPDIEILAALTSAGLAPVAPLYGWVETDALADDVAGEPVQLGILQQFLAGASDGWVLALEDLAAAAGDPRSFTTQAASLGSAVGTLHAALAASFPTQRWEGPQLAQVADAMTARLHAAREVVPELEEHAAGLTELFDGVRRLEAPVVAQRVHGDLHLGQTLWRQDDGWTIIDFEGEPAKTLEERRALDCALRDVAGMLRSFDYAAESERRSPGHDGDPERPRHWATATSEAFLTGYRDAGGAAPDAVLLRAYEADKAVYEAVYEARNRPTWLPIPLAALSRLTDRPHDATDRPVTAVRGSA